MSTLTDKHIVLGVTGSIAAYKSAELVRRLREAGATVRVIMTAAATAFITPLTLQALSGHPVRQKLMDPEAEAAMSHIELARWADAILVAPASADFLARLAHGLADDLLATVCLASQAPILVAPAMNRVMWESVATVENCATLRRRGAVILGPGEGEQACGELGFGRMLDADVLAAQVATYFGDAELGGVRVLITAGPTREALDPVRYLSNRSSGKMGYALAAAAAAAGARVTLVSGPVNLPAPRAVDRIEVQSAEQMFNAVMALAPECDIFVGVAAVADYRPVHPAANKLKKKNEEMHIVLEPTADILAAVAALSQAPFTVGFAAETDHVSAYARSKLRDKRLRMIVANRVGEGLGFDADDNALEVIWDGGEQQLARAPKSRLAEDLISIIAERYHAESSTEDSGSAHRA